MQSLNVAHLTLAQLEKLLHMVSYDPLKEQIHKIEETYPFTIPTWPIIFIMMLGTLMTATDIAVNCNCKYVQTRNKPKIFSAPWHRNNPKIIIKLKLCFPIPLNNQKPLTKQHLLLKRQERH